MEKSLVKNLNYLRLFTWHQSQKSVKHGTYEHGLVNGFVMAMSIMLGNRFRESDVPVRITILRERVFAFTWGCLFAGAIATLIIGWSK